MKIVNTFISIQGEGDLAGVPMFFVRTSGCSVAECPLHPAGSNLCDTDWKHRKDTSIEDLAKKANDSGIHWVCITGGEPTDQMGDIVRLAAACHHNGHRVMLQTSGVKTVPDCWDWLVVSPKGPFHKLKQSSGHEMKLVWNGEDLEFLQTIVTQTKFLRYFLQPLCQVDGQTNIEQTARMVLQCGELGLPYRLSIQQHKLWGGE